ncbi:uncharacterized protein LOC128219287 [Mya arenaria]|uniref:uncharacterized protein LOC128219287 n=1 Tax=Mya arenaria TaxID=6604 RepID=UPI0022E34F34|nr:uncharacterized protein LOC128219287 [Mya arenaria]
MVQKGGKHGIRTGHTIRAFNSKHNRRYWRHGVILLEGDNNIETTVRNESLNMVKNVPYSINKNGRWLLPDLIGEKFDECDPLDIDKRDYLFQKISVHAHLNHVVSILFVINCEKILRAEDKAGLVIRQDVSTDEPYFQQVETYKRNHSNYGTSLSRYRTEATENGQCVSTSAIEKRRGYFEIHTALIPPNSEELQDRLYLLGPCSKQTCAQVKRKHLGNIKRKPDYSSTTIRKPWTLTNKAKGYKQKAKVNNCNVINEGYEQALDEGWLNFPDYTISTNGHGKGDYIPCMNRKCRRKRSKRKQSAVKQNDQDMVQSCLAFGNETKEQVTLEENDDAVLVAPTTTTPEEYTDNLRTEDRDVTVEYVHEDDKSSAIKCPCEGIQMKSVRVLFSKYEITSKTLSKLYGQRIIECSCSPRRFLIDISNTVESVVNESSLTSKNRKRTKAFMIFVHDVQSHLNSVTEQAYDISINLNCPEITETISIDIVMDTLLSIVELITKTKRCISLNYKHNIHTEIISDVNVLQQRKKMLATLFAWNVDSYQSYDTVLLEHFLSQKPVMSHTNTDTNKSTPLKSSSRKTTASNNNICSICLTTAAPLSPLTTSLMACKHRFCNSCWESYIRIKCSSGVTSILCPEYSCPYKVDAATVLSFTPLPEVCKYLRYRQHVFMEIQDHSTWCPNEHCHRVLLRKSPNMKFAHCCCGDIFCFDCHGRPHWPLTCFQYRQFAAFVMESSDAVSPTDFIVKFEALVCRLCLQIVPQYTQCRDKHCKCVKGMCKYCSDVWHRMCEGLNEGNIFKRNYNVENAGYIQGKALSKWLNISHQCRKRRHPFRVQKLIVNSKALVRRIYNYLFNAKQAVKLDFDLEEEYFGHEATKSERYIQSFVELYAVLCEIAEFTSFCIYQKGESNSGEIQEFVLRFSRQANAICSLFKEGVYQRPERLLAALKDSRNRSLQAISEYSHKIVPLLKDT